MPCRLWCRQPPREARCLGRACRGRGAAGRPRRRRRSRARRPAEL